MAMTESSILTSGVWAVDPTHTEIGFTVRHMGLSKVRGRFNRFTGSATASDDLADSTVEAAIDLASVDTNNEMRDDHLRSTDFFDVTRNPQMHFRSTGIRHQGTTGVIAGELTINGVSRPVELETEFHGVGADAYGNTKAGFSATTRISRKDFGIDFNVPLDGGGVLIGDRVTIELDVQLARQ